MINTIPCEHQDRFLCTPFFCPRSADRITELNVINVGEGVHLSPACLETFYPSGVPYFVATGVQEIRVSATAGPVVLLLPRQDAGDVFVLSAWSRTNATAAPQSSESFATVRGRIETTVNVHAAAKLRVERLTNLQATLGLPVQALAEVLRISRASLYMWLDARQDIDLRADNRERLAAVERAAKLWRKRSSAPLSSVLYEPLDTGGTIFVQLTSERLDDDSLSAAFSELVHKLVGKPKTRSQLRAEVGFKRRASYRSLPPDE